MITKTKNFWFAASLMLTSALLTVPRTAFAQTCEQGNAQACIEQGEASSGILDILVAGINFLAAGVGLIAVAMIIVAGIQYTTSSGNPQAVQAAKTRIINVLIGLGAFFFLYAFMQWLVPGGIL